MGLNLESTSSSVVRRQLGRRLRRLREAAGRSHEDVAEAQIASRTKMWKIEAGRTAVKQGDVLALARLYGLDGSTTDDLVALASATKSSGFQEDYGSSMPEWVGLYGDLEAGVAVLRDYNCELIHGLLQTEDYARAVTEVNTALSPEVVEQRVAFRMRRQRALFDRPNPGRIDAVITAGALDLVVGSPTVMEAQIAHLRAVCSGDEVSVRVLTRTNGLHAAMRGPFTIMDFDDPEDPPLVYLESLIGSRYVERPDQIAEFRSAFDQMRAKAVSLEEYVT
jgi:transcriptional regulator with XRE-family HTH domain